MLTKKRFMGVRMLHLLAALDFFLLFKYAFIKIHLYYYFYYHVSFISLFRELREKESNFPDVSAGVYVFEVIPETAAFRERDLLHLLLHLLINPNHTSFFTHLGPDAPFILSWPSVRSRCITSSYTIKAFTYLSN